MQKLQMASQKGGNVHVCAINGNFDDAQTGVKKIFTDKAVAERLLEHNMQFSLRQLNKLGETGAADSLLCIRLLRFAEPRRKP